MKTQNILAFVFGFVRSLNRPANGSGLSPTQLIEKLSDIRRELGSGHSIRRTAKLTGKAKSTVQRVKKAINEVIA